MHLARKGMARSLNWSFTDFPVFVRDVFYFIQGDLKNWSVLVGYIKYVFNIKYFVKNFIEGLFS